MSDNQNQDQAEVPQWDMVPEDKARIYAAMRMLLEYVIENTYLNYSRVPSEKCRKCSPEISDAISVSAGNDG